MHGCMGFSLINLGLQETERLFRDWTVHLAGEPGERRLATRVSCTWRPRDSWPGIARSSPTKSFKEPSNKRSVVWRTWPRRLWLLRRRRWAMNINMSDRKEASTAPGRQQPTAAAQRCESLPLSMQQINAATSQWAWQIATVQLSYTELAAEFRPVCDEQSESLLCPQTDALVSKGMGWKAKQFSIPSQFVWGRAWSTRRSAMPGLWNFMKLLEIEFSWILCQRYSMIFPNLDIHEPFCRAVWYDFLLPRMLWFVVGTGPWRSEESLNHFKRTTSGWKDGCSDDLLVHLVLNMMFCYDKYLINNDIIN